jgi:hypothetical protein
VARLEAGPLSLELLVMGSYDWTTPAPSALALVEVLALAAAFGLAFHLVGLA